MGKYGKNRWITSGTCGNFVFFRFLMGKTMEHDGKRFGTCGETIEGFNGFDGKNVEACGSLR
jgi:hypothetical protein